MTKRFRKVISEMGFEPIIWLVALLWLGLSQPEQSSDFTLCPLSNIGIKDCPGCGLGKSVSYALHGQFSKSMQTHLLGIPAIIILSFRICSIFRNTLRNQRSRNHSISNKRSSYDKRNAINANP